MSVVSDKLRERYTTFLSTPSTGSSVPSVRQKLLASDSLNLESIIYQTLSAITMSSLMVKDVGDTTQAHAIQIELIQILDVIVYGLFLAERFLTLQPYFENRKRILTSWQEAQERGEDEIDYARDLLTLTIKTLAEQRVFQIKRELYFGFGWLQEQTNVLERKMEDEEAAIAGIERVEDRDEEDASKYVAIQKKDDKEGVPPQNDKNGTQAT